jgi:hypothetical protein
MPAMWASLSMASATIAADLNQLRLARHFADEDGAHEETHLGIEKVRGALADVERAAVRVGSEPDPGSAPKPWQGDDNAT